jgi:hypothetical protein
MISQPCTHLCLRAWPAVMGEEDAYPWEWRLISQSCTHLSLRAWPAVMGEEDASVM